MSARSMSSDPKIADTTATAYTIPTDAPEADGTYAWDKTTLVVVEMKCEGATGLGYTYTPQDGGAARSGADEGACGGPESV